MNAKKRNRHGNQPGVVASPAKNARKRAGGRASVLRRTSSLLALAAGCGLAPLFAAAPASAQTVHWDGGVVNGGNPAVNANGGTGTWDTTLTNWDTLATGGADTAWVNGAFDATFSGSGASTVTLGVPIIAHNLTFSSTYILNGSTLTLTGATPTITTTGLAVINSVIDGSAGLTKAGTSGLTLNGDNTFTGGITVNAGTLNFDSVADSGVASALGVSGAILADSTSSAVILNYTGTGHSSSRDWTLNSAASSVTLRNSGTGKLTLTGNIALTRGNASNLFRRQMPTLTCWG